MGHGGEIGSVGLDQQSIERNHPRGFPRRLGFGKSEHAAEAEMEPEIERLPRLGRSAGEAVEDAFALVVFAQDLNRVAPGFARVDDDRLAGGLRHLELPEEHGPLRVGGLIVMVVEADLAEREHFGMREQIAQTVEGFVCRFGGVVGMDSDGRIDERIAIGQPDRGFEIGRAVAGADGHEAFDSGRLGALDHGLAIFGELFVIEMTVGIDQLHLRRAPTGTSSRKPASTGLPPSSEAATIIPFDMMPRSFRGAPGLPRSRLSGR